VARAFDAELRWSDLRRVVPIGATPEDSTAMAQAFITSWLKQQVVLHQAGQNLADAQKDFEARIQDYRNSLLIFAYEHALVDQKLDTVVPDHEIAEHYQANLANFTLSDTYLRVRWAKVRDNDRRTLKRLEDLFRSNNDDRQREFEVWLAQRGIPFQDRSQQWSALSDLRAEVPVLTGERSPVAQGRTVLRDGDTAWFLDVLEVRAREAPAPIDLVRQDIRAIILNQRKLRLLERMREDLYQRALQDGSVEVL
jgi:hypothetical protein